MANSIDIKGARAHNLKNIDVVIPRVKLVVITCLEGRSLSAVGWGRYGRIAR